WDLSNLPYDDKGPLVTQTLRGIEALLPFHWRGERHDLVDFNPAFDGLLGGQVLDPNEFAQFQAFVFSVHSPANAHADPRRIVSNRVLGFTPPPGSVPDAIHGQILWFDVPTMGASSCNTCHTLPTGTDNDIFRDEAGAVPKRSHFKVAPTNALWRKEQPSHV